MKKLGAKKITALASAMVLVTIGGVYAQWVFTGTNSKYGTGGGELSVNITTYTTNDSLGSYSVDKTGTVYTIDQYSQALLSVGASSTYASASTSAVSPTAHNAALCVNNDATFKITFTATDAADQEVYDNGIQTTLTLTWGTLGYYYDSGSGYSFETVDVVNIGTATTGYSSIFTMVTNEITIYPVGTSGNNIRTWTADTTAGVFYYEMTADDFASLFTIADIVIEDVTTYGNFGTAVSSTTVNVAIAAVTN